MVVSVDYGASVLGVGDCTLDFIFRSPHPLPGATVPVAYYKSEGGGLTATALVACARLGGRAELICRLGDDPVGQTILEGLVAENVGVGRVVNVPGCKSSVSFVHVDAASGERTIHYYRDGGLDVAGSVPPDWDLEGIDCLLVDDTWLAATVPAAKKARTSGIPVIADLTPSEDNAELVSTVDILIAPSMFASRFAEDGDCRPALSEIHRMGPAVAIVTLGKSGCWYSDGESVGHVDAFSVEVVDTTGAGDTFHGAFAFGTANGWDIERRIVFSSAVAALKCRSMGGRSGIPSLQEVFDFLRQEGRADWPELSNPLHAR